MNYFSGLKITNNREITATYIIGSHRELTLDVSTLTPSQLKTIRTEFAVRTNYSYYEQKHSSTDKKEHVYLIIPHDESTPVFPIREIFTLKSV